MKRFWMTLVLAAVGCQSAPTHPVVLISIDTLRRDRVGSYAPERQLTENLDTLAADAVVFDDAIAAHTNTLPSHVTMLTGLSPLAHGGINNGIPMRPGVRTLSDILREKDYATAAFVSGGPLKNQHTQLGPHFDHYGDGFPRGMRSAEQTFRLAEKWINERESSRWFLFIHFYEPHWQYNPSRRFKGLGLPLGAPVPKLPKWGEVREDVRSGNHDAHRDMITEYKRRYDAEVKEADYWAGEVIMKLRSRKEYDGALIMVTSDHGETLDEHPWVFDHGARVTEEQIRVPLIVKLPKNERRGSRVRHQVGHVDMTPTALEALGLRRPGDLEGVSMMPAIRGQPQAERPAFALARRVPKRIRRLEADLPPETKLGDASGLVVSVRRPPYKLIDYAPLAPQGHLLHDLRDDAAESRDVSAEHIGRSQPMHKELTEWIRVGLSRGGATRGDIDAKTREELRALGYIE